MASRSVIHPVKQKSQNLVSLRREARATLSPELHHHLVEIPAYRCGRSRLMNVERALKAAAFLIDWSTDTGNEPLDGPLAFAVTQVLDTCAAEVEEMRVWAANEFLKPPVRRAAKSGRI